MKVLSSVITLTLGCVVGVAACVGDSTKDGSATTGTAGQPCFPNGTCATGLACTLVGPQALCEPPGDASAEGGASSCGMAPAPPAFPCSGNTKVACYDAASTVTCVSSASDCAPDAGPSGAAQGCFSEKDCASGDVCCLQDGANYATDHCPGTLELTSSPSACGATLPTGSGNCAKGSSPGDRGDAVLCSTSAGCPKGQSCYPVRLNAPTSLQGQLFGLCL